LRQLIASNEACIEAVAKQPCDLLIDTVGVGFAYPVLRLFFGCKIVSYTHYPTISSDMVAQVDKNQFNNQYANNPVKKMVKKVYYRLLMSMYSVCGIFANQIATNSSWTDEHI
jgi:alpha-1,2-mannosyltransferase